MTELRQPKKELNDTFVLLHGRAMAFGQHVVAGDPATAVRALCKELIQTGRSPDLPAHITRNGWLIARLPSLRAGTALETYTPEFVSKLNPPKPQAEASKRRTNRTP